jgi:hypothetical protein
MVIATGTHVSGGLRDLQGPVFDAMAMTGTLQQLGSFQVQSVLIDRPAAELLSRITAFLESFDDHETALIYFSGHGFKSEDGALWLAATDTRREAPEQTALNAATVRSLLETCQARAKIWILDCCNAAAAGLPAVPFQVPRAKGDDSFFGPLTRGYPQVVDEGDGQPASAVSVARAEKGAADPPRQGRGLYFLFAAGDGEPADDGDGGSPYTKLLIKGMTSIEADRDGDGWVSAWELARYVDEQHRRLIPELEVVRMVPSSDVHGAAEGEVWMIRVPKLTTRRRTPLRRALGDPVGPVSGVAAGLTLGAVTWVVNDSGSAALAAAIPVGLGGYLVYLAAGTYLLRRPAD